MLKAQCRAQQLMAWLQVLQVRVGVGSAGDYTELRRGGNTERIRKHKRKERGMVETKCANHLFMSYSLPCLIR